MTAHTHRKATPKQQDARYLPLPSSKRLLAAQAAARQAEVQLELTPLAELPGDRLTRESWCSLLEEILGRELVDPEGATAAHFLQRHAPMRSEMIGNKLALPRIARQAEALIAH